MNEHTSRRIGRGASTQTEADHDLSATPLDASLGRPALALGPGEEPLRRESLASSDRTESLTGNEEADGSRAVALSDFGAQSLSAGERLIRLAYSWGVPTAAMNPFKKPVRPRLVATVTNPLRGDRSAGTALRAGHFLLYGVKAPIADVSFSGPRLSPPFERMVHGFQWLRDLEACAPRAQCVPVAERVISAWLAANPRPDGTPAWDVGHTGHRLLNWLIHAPLLLSGPDRTFRARVLGEIDRTARWLDRHTGRAEDKLAEVAGWCGITAAGLLLSEGRARRLYGEAGLIRALGDSIGDDGGVLSRSPLCQIEAISLLVRLRSCYTAVRQEPPRQIESMLELLVPPLLSVLHGDGALGNWQGSGALDAGAIDALIAASGVRTRPLRDTRQWGYQRIAARRGLLIVDAAPPPHSRHAREGCASTLAFEFSHGAQRIVVNCGGAALAGGQIPQRLAQGLRATAAHSTLTIDDFNSTAVLINGKLGAGVSAVDLDRRSLPSDSVSNGAAPGATRLEASHDGYLSRYGLVHRRILLLRDDGTELRGEDLLVPSGRKGRRGTIGVALRFHLDPDVELAAGQDGQGVTLALPDGSIWQFRSARDTISIEDSLWADGQGRPHPARQLVIQAKIPRSGESFSWLLKKMR